MAPLKFAGEGGRVGVEGGDNNEGKMEGGQQEKINEEKKRWFNCFIGT